MIVDPVAQLSEESLLSLFASIWVISFIFIIFIVNGPSNFPQACKSILNSLRFAGVELLPVYLLAFIAVAVFASTFLALTAWFSVVVRHDTSDIPHFKAEWTRHLFKLTVLDTRYFGEHPRMVLCGVNIVTLTLPFLIFERRRFARERKDNLAKCLAIEHTTAQAYLTAQKCVQQLAEAEASLVCLICVDRLTQPYTLAPCGHTFDLDCLQTWFRSAHPSPDDEQLALTLDRYGALFALRRKKFCPLCHAEVVGCPAPALALMGLGMEPTEEGTPWKGLFLGFVRSRIPCRTPT
ncbi:hypothetical protein B0H15DRAFT_850598 [Mycena belliarum]|uniref:RING-type domain-containing protein n=1 Tax=Mycena belliarum TaxID=1033014 RepID=A0AAD6TXV5_9AGAR|nr:hypothetical protein B0H15DRAFT_850598 [Mycena belliae]